MYSFLYNFQPVWSLTRNRSSTTLAPSEESASPVDVTIGCVLFVIGVTIQAQLRTRSVFDHVVDVYSFAVGRKLWVTWRSTAIYTGPIPTRQGKV